MIDHWRFSEIVYRAGRVIRVEGIVVGGVGVACLLAGWHSSAEIAQAFLIAGVLILIVSLLGSFAGRNDPHCVEHQVVRATMRDFSADDRAQQDQPGSRLDVSQLLQGALLGGLTMGIAWIVSVL